jgi:hypothetical protein
MEKDREAHESEDAALRKKRALRIRDYLRDALDHPDPLQAILRASSSDLTEMAGQLKDAIDQALQDDPDFRSAFQEVSPLLEMYLKFQRQFDRFVQLDRRLSTPSSPSAASPPPPTSLSFAGKSDEASEESRS